MRDKTVTLTRQTEWITLKGKQRALFYNPGNALKRKYMLSYIINYIARNKRREKRTLILDVGSGVGDLALEFFLKGMYAEYILLDIDRDAILESKYALKNFNTKFILADAQNLPLKSEVFEMVICSEVLEHLPDDTKALQEMSRVLHKQGVMVISVPLHGNLDEVHARIYSLNAFLRLINSANLGIKNICYACRTIQVIGTLLHKFFGRKGMGERESSFYMRLPLISKLLVSILSPIDSLLTSKHSYLSSPLTNKATLIAVLTKKGVLGSSGRSC
jgi:2-polyprenyl-3-methyl-5-hydroxy-6-metoxy-1,4-benzoquinol methylase